MAALWPWEIARRGGEHLARLADAASALAAAAQAVAGAPDGPGVVAAVVADPTDTTRTNRVLESGLFGPALAAVEADDLLRTVFVGASAGAQVGLLGGGGASGTATDVTDRRRSAPVHYEQATIGIGAQVASGLVVGALGIPATPQEHVTRTFEVGARLVGVGALVQVLMDDHLDLIGFTLAVGIGVGLSSATGYGSIRVG